MKKQYMLLIIVLAGLIFTFSQNNTLYHIKKLFVDSPRIISETKFYNGQLKFTDIEIIENTYWGVKVAFTYFQPIKHGYEKLKVIPGPDFLPRESIETLLFKTVQQGKRLTIFIPRPKGVFDAFNTSQLVFELQRSGEIQNSGQVEKFSSKEVFEKEIMWISLEQAQNKLVQKEEGFKKLRSLTISETVPNREMLVEWLVGKGVSPKEIYIEPSYADGSITQIRIADKIPSQDLKELTSKMRELNINIVSFNASEQKREGLVEIGVDWFINKTMTENLLDQLATQDLSTEAFYDIAGINWLEAKEESVQLALKAKELIDNQTQLDLAKKYIDQALNLDPNQPKAYIELARYIMKSSDDFSENRPSATGNYVVDILSKALEISPLNTDVMVLLGYALIAQDRFEEAESNHQKVASIGTENWWFWNNWALQKRKQGLYEESIKLYKEITDETNISKDNQLPYSDAIWDLSRIYVSLGRISEADQVLEARHKLIGTKLHSCIYRHHARILVQHTVDYDRAIEHANTAQSAGCESNHIVSQARFHKWADAADAVNPLLLLQAKSATPNLAGIFYELATYEKGTSVLKKLVKAGENLDAESSEGGNALVYAVSNNNIEALTNLISSGANPNTFVSNNTWSPLLVSVSQANEEAIKVLLKHGADPSLKNAMGVNAVELAKQMGQSHLISVLSIPST